MKLISFTQNQIKLFDELLSDSYDKTTTREHYLLFLLKLEENMAYIKNDEMPYINNNKERIKYGLTTVSGKRKWRLDIILKTLIDKNILVSTSYNKEKRLCRNYFYSPYFEYLLSEQESIIVQEEISDELYEKIISEREVPTDLYLLPQYNLLKSDRFKIDTIKATTWINSQNLSSNKLRIYFRYVLDLNDKRIISIKGDHSNRVFTNFNLMKRELRSFCTIDNKPLISIDLKSSQPYLFASYMLSKYNTDEANRFYNIVVEDDIYNWFLNKWKESGQESYMCYDKNQSIKVKKFINDRELHAKPEFLKLLFKLGGTEPPFTTIFRKEFPTLYTMLLNEKTTLCERLQRQESDIFIPITNQFSNQGALSVHDSIYFVEDIRNEILTQLEEKFTQLKLTQYKFNY